MQSIPGVSLHKILLPHELWHGGFPSLAKEVFISADIVLVMRKTGVQTEGLGEQQRGSKLECKLKD